MSQETAEALAEAHEAYTEALLAHVTDETQGGADEDDDERREELVAQTLTELRKDAKAAGASPADIKKCGSDKEALADLVIELEAEDDDDDDDEDEDEDEDDDDDDDEDEDEDEDEDDEPPAKSKKSSKKPAKKKR